jgi:benzoyl-CoA reductase/2-hydroxyglutaryl-CoA dehydratase subunit BcrC/BadD/HgdB
MGAYDTGIKTTLGGIDKPDLITCTNTICDTHWKWFQIMAHKLDVPFYMFDIPKWVTDKAKRRIEALSITSWSSFSFSPVYEKTFRPRYQRKKYIMT